LSIFGGEDDKQNKKKIKRKMYKVIAAHEGINKP
jgi:hypothetical protein